VFVFPCASEAEALSDEMQVIAQLKSEGFALANMTSGGEGSRGFRHTSETRKQMSLSRVGGPKHTAEGRAKMSAANIGIARNIGYRHTQEHIEKLKNNQHAKGHKHSAESREKMRAAAARRAQAKAAKLPERSSASQPAPQPV